MNELNTQTPENERKESNAIAPYSAKASAVMVASMLDFTRELLLISEDLAQRQADFWIMELAAYPPDLIKRAFHMWLQRSKYMPLPAEILAILDGLMEDSRQKQAAMQTTAYLEECREIRTQLRANGEPSGEAQFALLMKQCAEIAQSFPAPDPDRRRTLQERIAQARAGRVSRRKPPAAEFIRAAKEAIDGA